MIIAIPKKLAGILFEKNIVVYYLVALGDDGVWYPIKPSEKGPLMYLNEKNGARVEDVPKLYRVFYEI